MYVENRRETTLGNTNCIKLSDDREECKVRSLMQASDRQL